jgi:hypothetical protein
MNILPSIQMTYIGIYPSDWEGKHRIKVGVTMQHEGKKVCQREDRRK